MKALKLLLLSLIFSPLCSVAQTIYVANNNPGAVTGTNVFIGSSALQDAINAATSGDIIHVIPGSTSYGNVIVDNKSLTILGVGLNPQKNISTRSIVGDLSLNHAGSSGSIVSGLHLNRLILANVNDVVHTVSNILLENCLLRVVIGPGYLTNSLSGLIVRNCIFNSSNATTNPQAFELYTVSGVIISNNIIRGKCCVSGAIQGDGLTIEHNFFYYNDTGGAFHNITNSVVQNNIFYGTSPSVGSGQSGNTFINNLSFGTANTFTNGVEGNTATGNIENSDPLLTNMTFTSSSWNFSQDITLMTGSPALGAGSDGTDIGPSGGANPYDPEGTFLPLIEALNIPATVSQGSDLNVNVKAKGN
ncbi:MAG TPA: hypothetical protein PKL31_08830 [Fulvivirga sp.]|nr:hypothetical protein [Fulvivirga sp.]